MASSASDLLYPLGVTAIVIFNITGNSLVCLVILKNKAMKTATNWLLFHLAIADLLVAIFFIPPCTLSLFIELPSGAVGDLLCKFITGGALGWAAASSSSFLLVVIAFERYSATLHPFETLRRSRPLWSVPTLWILAILLNIPSLLFTTFDPQSQMCQEIFPDYTSTRAYYLTWSFASSVLPICIMGYLYVRVILRLRKRVDVPGYFPGSALHSRNKVTKMLVSVSLIFIVCWTPPAVLCVLSPAVPGGYATVAPITRAFALLNSCLNPLVYTLHSRQFRKNLTSLVFCYKNKQLTARKTAKRTNASAVNLSAFNRFMKK